MCKRYGFLGATVTQREAYSETYTEQGSRAEAYEGQTIRLPEVRLPAAPSLGQPFPVTDEPTVQSFGQQCRHHWPWHLLWLGWPLFWLGKGLVLLMMGAAATLLAWLSSPVPIWPLLLIGLGAWLLLREPA